MGPVPYAGTLRGSTKQHYDEDDDDILLADNLGNVLRSVDILIFFQHFNYRKPEVWNHPHAM